MSNIVMYRKVEAGPKKNDTQRFGGRVSKSEFARRTKFIQKRIALGYSREEVAFLIGRYPGLILGYEEMAAGVRPGPTDFEALSEAMSNDIPALLPPEGEDLLRWDVSGTRQVKKGVIYYEMTLETYEKRKAKFKAEEKLLSAYTEEEDRDHMLTMITLQQMLHGTYFLSSKSALEILSSLHQALVPQIRPIILKHAINQLIISGQICCFRNNAGQLRYHKRMH